MTRRLWSISRLTAPLARPLAGRRMIKLWAVLSHSGRRSGRIYAIPVAVARTSDGFVVPIPFGERTQWVKNVLAAGGCQLRWAGREYRLVEPEIVDRATGASAFNQVERGLLGPIGIDQFVRLRESAS